ncbi:MAG TPA: DUF835 domain-containing protein [Methanomassiliicoccales archaeon]|nr:DUF835 domain-containing protein [Methanomassiliicoccales archaeon]
MVSEGINSKISLLTESYPRYGFEALSMLINTGWDALCITRLHPDYVTKKFGLSKIKCQWLSTRKGKEVISPKSLGLLVKVVKASLKKNDCTIIFLDGLEYLLMWNDMSKVILTLREIDSMLENKTAEMLICIDPLALEQRDLDRLFSEFPQHSTTEVVEILSTELPQQIAEVLPGTADRTIADLLRSGELHAIP